MRIPDRLLHWAAILIPILFLVAITASPIPIQLRRLLTGAKATGDLHPAAAALDLEQAAAMQPWRDELWEQAGEMQMEAANYTAAQTDYEKAQSIGGLSAQGMLHLGDAYSASNNLQKAVAIWQTASTHGAASSDLDKRIARAHRAMGDLSSLGKDLTEHVKRYPADTAGLYELALVTSITQPDQARAWAEQAKAADPSLVEPMDALISSLTPTASDSSPAYRMLLTGRELGALGAWDLAEAAFQRALDDTPGYADAWAFMGEAKQQLGKDGASELAKAEQLGPSSVVVQTLEAVFWQRQGKFDQALVYLHAAAEQQPDNPVWLAEIGGNLAEMGDLESAMTYYQAATDLAPKDPVYWRELAAFCIRYNSQLHDIGLPAARQAVLLAPDDADGLDVMGQILLSYNDLVGAERFFIRATEKAPQNDSARFHLGSLYLQQGNMDAARSQLELASNLHPSTDIAVQARRLLNQYFP